MGLEEDAVYEPQELLEDARKIQPQVVALRRSLHQEPELGLALPETRRRVLAELEDLDLEVTLHRRSSAVVATLRGAHPGPAVLLRADMDALPMPEDTDLPYRSRREGVMHACGHDAHTAMLTGAARLLAARRDALAGDVVLAFQAGEEGHFGARVMIEEGLLDRTSTVESAFALHVAPLLPPGTVATRSGPIFASADVFGIDLRGKGGHASMPHDCIDPIPVACEIVQALQSFVTRRIPAFDPVVLTVTRIEAGTTNNVIPETVHLEGTLRSVSEASRSRAAEGIRRVVEGVASAHDVEASVAVVSGYPVTVNDAARAHFAMEVAGGLLGAGHAIELPSPIMGAEDFSYVLQRAPGALLLLGVRPPGVAAPAPCHSNRMLLDEEGMVHGTALYAALALARLGAARRDTS
jgi:amidohydrolase